MSDKLEQIAERIATETFPNGPRLRYHVDRRYLDLKDQILSALRAVQAEASSSRWQPSATAPIDGTAFHAHGPALIDPDYNPWGVVEACFDGERFIGAVWNGSHDIWNTLPITFTAWAPIEAPR